MHGKSENVWVAMLLQVVEKNAKKAICLKHRQHKSLRPVFVGHGRLMVSGKKNDAVGTGGGVQSPWLRNIDPTVTLDVFLKNQRVVDTIQLTHSWLSFFVALSFHVCVRIYIYFILLIESPQWVVYSYCRHLSQDHELCQKLRSTIRWSKKNQLSISLNYKIWVVR